MNAKLRSSRYYARRAHLTVFYWDHDSTVAVDLALFLKAGESYLILNVLDFDCQPASAGHYGGEPIELAVQVEERTGEGQICAYVILRESAS